MTLTSPPRTEPAGSTATGTDPDAHDHNAPDTDAHGADAPDTEGTAPRRPLLLRALSAHPAWIVIAGVAAALLRVAMHSGITNDAWWHLAAGRWMLDHHAVIRRDVFSYTVTGRPWVAEEWGFEVALAWVVRTVGGVGFWVITAGPCIAALLLGVWRWRRLGAGMLRTAGISIVAGGYLLMGEAPRPQVFSYALFAGLLMLLTLARRNPRWLLAAPGLFLVWANVHGSFLAGLAILALDALLCARPFRRRRVVVSDPVAPRSLVLTLVASTVATLVNPHGPGLLSYAFHVASAPQLTAHISEWQSPNLGSTVLLLLVFGPVVLTVAVAVLSDATFNAFDLVLWGGLLTAGLHSQRFLPYAGLAWCGLMARTVSRETIRPTILTWPLAAIAAVALVSGPHVPPGAAERGGSNGEPVAAVQWLASHPGRVLSEYSWDDYLIGQGRPVFVDGRTDLYFGTNVFDQYLQVAGVTADPDTVLSRWDVAYVLWPKSTPLAVYLSHDPRWRVAFRSGDSVVFSRTAG